MNAPASAPEPSPAPPAGRPDGPSAVAGDRAAVTSAPRRSGPAPAPRPASPLVRLPVPEPGRWPAEAFVLDHLADVIDRRRPRDEPLSSATVRGGQLAAENALRRFRLDRYAARGRLAYPVPQRVVSGLSPWIRHGLLTLPRVWDSVAGGPDDDVHAFRRALLRQEYARHLYARLGRRLGDLLPRPESLADPGGRVGDRAEVRSGDPRSPWDRRRGCVETPLEELADEGWLPAEARRWLVTQADPGDWSRIEDLLHRELLDGSRAGIRLALIEALGGLGSASAASMTRWDVETWAPGLCASCELVYQCPIERRAAGPGASIDPPTSDPPTSDPTTSDPTTSDHAASGRIASGHTGPDSARAADARWLQPGPGRAEALALLEADPDPASTAGPRVVTGPGGAEQVWLTAESLGDADPALAANPGLGVVFVFDEPLLRRLRPAPARLVFVTETLAELARRRTVELWLGDPVRVLGGRRLAVTHTPVPGWRRLVPRLDVVERHPWPWLRWPHGSQIGSFDCWNAPVLCEN